MSARRSGLAITAILAGSTASGLGGAGHLDAQAQEATAGGECVRGAGGERFGGVAGVVRVEAIGVRLAWAADLERARDCRRRP